MQARDLVSLWTPSLGPFSSIPKGGSRWISHGDRKPQCQLWAVVTLGRQAGTREVTEFGSGLWSHDGTQDCGTYSDCGTGTFHSADELWLLTTSRHTFSPLLSMALSLLKVSKPPLHNHFTSSFPEGIEDQNRMWRMTGNDGKDCIGANSNSTDQREIRKPHSIRDRASSISAKCHRFFQVLFWLLPNVFQKGEQCALDHIPHQVPSLHEETCLNPQLLTVPFSSNMH